METCKAVGIALVFAGHAGPGTEPHKTAEKDADRLATKISDVWKDKKHTHRKDIFKGDTLVSKEEDVDLQGDGTFDYRFVKIFDNGQLAYAETVDRTRKRVVRSYYHNGKMIVEEGDANADGFFETMILFAPDEQPVEAFEKEKDGSVVRFSTEKLLELKRAFSLPSEIQ